MNDVVVDQQAPKFKKAKVARKTMTPDEEIAELQLKLKNAIERKKRLDLELADKNRKAIDSLLKSEKLDSVDVSVWIQNISSIKQLLVNSRAA